MAQSRFYLHTLGTYREMGNVESPLPSPKPWPLRSFQEPGDSKPKIRSSWPHLCQATKSMISTKKPTAQGFAAVCVLL